MPKEAHEPLTKILLNLNTSDVEFLKLNVGYGWTSVIRELVREYVTQLESELDSTKSNLKLESEKARR